MEQITNVAEPNKPLSPEEKKVAVPASQWDDDYALKVVLPAYDAAIADYTRNRKSKYDECMSLYLAATGQRTWQGTNIPRSNVQVFTMLVNVETLLANEIGAIFSGDMEFDVEPMPNTTVKQAIKTRVWTQSQLRDMGGEGEYLTLREVVRRCKKNANIFGNGIAEIFFDRRDVEECYYTRKQLPERAVMGDALVPTDGSFEQAIEDIRTRKIRRPRIEVIDPRDFFIDPNCPSHNIQEAGFAGTHKLHTIGQLKQLAAADPNIKLPSDEQLLKLAEQKTSTPGDTSKQTAESSRGNQANPIIDASPDLLSRNVRVIRYQQRDREVWILGRSWVAYNRPNKLNRLRFHGCHYVDVPGRWQALSMADVVRSDQKLIKSLIDARLDELNLIINAVTRMSPEAYAQNPASARVRRPGLILKGNKDDIEIYETGNVTASAYVEVEAANERTQKSTGVTDVAGHGMATGGGNSANRTATGVATQKGATSTKFQYQVENLQDHFIIPLLYTLHRMNQIFLDPNEPLKLTGEQIIDPLDVMNASVRFNIKAATKMRTRASLQAGGYQVLAETFLNPGMVAELAKVGKRVSYENFAELLTDAMNMPPQQLIVDMTPEEMQAMQQPSPDKLLADQMQDKRLQAQEQMSLSKEDTALLTALLKLLQGNPKLLKEATGLDVVDDPKPAAEKK